MTQDNWQDEEQQRIARHRLIKKQARIDPVCAALLAEEATNHRLGGGKLWIETQLDMEEDEDDFRPY